MSESTSIAAPASQAGTCVVCCQEFTAVGRRRIKCLLGTHDDACRECWRRWFMSGKRVCVVECKKEWSRAMIAGLVPECARHVKCDVPFGEEIAFLGEVETMAYVGMVHGMGQRWGGGRALELMVGCADDGLMRVLDVLRVSVQNVARVYGRVYGQRHTLLTNAETKAMCEKMGIVLRGPGGGIGELVGASGRRDEVLGMFEGETPAWRSFLGTMVTDGCKEWIGGTYNDVDLHAIREIVSGAIGGDATGQPSRGRSCGWPECAGLVGEYGCMLCGRQQCGECLVSYEDDGVHVCKAEDLAAIETAVKRSVACPACGMRIQKERESDCPVMLCVNIGCGTYFNYETGAAIRGDGLPANPHVDEWRARTGMGTAAAGGCDVGTTTAMLDGALAMVPDARRLVRVAKLLGPLEGYHLDYKMPHVIRECRRAAHQSGLDAVMRGESERVRMQRNVQGRLDHVMNGTSREMFVRATEQAYRKIEVEWRYGQVCREYDIAGQQLKREMYDAIRLAFDVGGGGAFDDVVDAMEEKLKGLVGFFSELLEDVGRVYGTPIYKMAIEDDNRTLVFRRVLRS